MMYHFKKLASFLPGTEAASLDITKAYQNSPICPEHKKYLCIYWKEAIYVLHVTIEGLSTAGGIQGSRADATVAVLKYHAFEPTIKWVDDFMFFWTPTLLVLPGQHPTFLYDLSTIFNITDPLGIPWHPVSKRAMTFSPLSPTSASAGTFLQRPCLSHLRNAFAYLSKVSNLLVTPPSHVTKKTIASIHGSLQHITIVYLQGWSHLAPLSSFHPSFQTITSFTIFQNLVSTYFPGRLQH